jgi:predicted nuclease of predicted toxin-antitoxin system
MTNLKLYFDENVPEAIAAAIRLRGYDVTTVRDTGRKAASDLDQLSYASLQKRILFTFNVADFVKLHDEFMATGRHHSGILLSKQLPVGIIVNRLLKLLSRLPDVELKNNIIWLND